MDSASGAAVPGLGRRKALGSCLQVAQQQRQAIAQLGARHDLVDEAVAVQELGALEALRQLVARGPRRHARAGEPDEGVRLGQVDVPEGRERGEDAARRGVGQDADVGHPCPRQALHGGAGLDQLHEGQRALLHARPARGADGHQRHALVEGSLRGPRDLLPDDRPHRPAHEGEVHDADGDALAADPPEAPDGGVADAGLALLFADPLRVRLQIDEAERIERIRAPHHAHRRSRRRAGCGAGHPRAGGSGVRSGGRRAGSSRAACCRRSPSTPDSSSRARHGTTRGADGRAAGWALQAPPGGTAATPRHEGGSSERDGQRDPGSDGSACQQPATAAWRGQTVPPPRTRAAG